jgi:hypothetical protein
MKGQQVNDKFDQTQTKSPYFARAPLTENRQSGNDGFEAPHG